MSAGLLGYAAGVGAYGRGAGPTPCRLSAVGRPPPSTPWPPPPWPPPRWARAIGGAPRRRRRRGLRAPLAAVPLLAARPFAAGGRTGLAPGVRGRRRRHRRRLVLEPGRRGPHRAAGSGPASTVGHAWLATSALAVLATRRR